MVLDPGMSRGELDTNLAMGKNRLSLENLGEEKESVKIHLNTLTQFVGFQPGSYALYALKKIKTSDGFLGLNENERGCQIEPFEDCDERNYFEKAKTQCGCTPWSLIGNVSNEASFSIYALSRFFNQSFISRSPSFVLLFLHLV